jgi:hypothetical protein
MKRIIRRQSLFSWVNDRNAKRVKTLFLNCESLLYPLARDPKVKHSKPQVINPECIR